MVFLSRFLSRFVIQKECLRRFYRFLCVFVIQKESLRRLLSRIDFTKGHIDASFMTTRDNKCHRDSF
jgi:hypothetical protein